MSNRRGPSLKQTIDAINVSPIEHALRPYYKKWEKGDGNPGRPPCDPVGMVLSLLICLIREWNLEDLTSFLDDHEEWRRWLGFEDTPDPTTWSKLLDRVPITCLEELLSGLARDLRDDGLIRLRVAATDGSFLAACSWDDDAEWGYAGRKKDYNDRGLPRGKYRESEDGKLIGYGYRIHALVDADSELPVTVHVTRANKNDVSQWPVTFEKSREHDGVDWTRVGFLAGDKAYDSATVRDSFKTYQTRVVAPPANTPKRLAKGGLKGLEAEVYEERTSVERFFAQLKGFFSLRRWGITGLDRVQKWVLLASIACVVVAVVNRTAGRPLHSIKGFVRALR